MRFKGMILLFCLFLSLSFARPTLLILDSTGSMRDTMPTGMTKIDAVKQAATEIVNSANDEIAIEVFSGCDNGGDYTSGNIQVVQGFTTDKAALLAVIDSIAPKSDTAIAKAVEEGSAYVKASGRSAGMVVLTDGEETCSSLDPSSLGAIAEQSGVQIINVVGFQIGEDAQSDMQALASAGGGQYYDADDEESLSSAMQQAYGSSSGMGCCGASILLSGLVGAAALIGRD